MTKTWLKFATLSQKLDFVLRGRPLTELSILLKPSAGCFPVTGKLTTELTQLLRSSDGLYAASYEPDSAIKAASKVTRCVKLLPHTSLVLSSGFEKWGITDVVVKKKPNNSYLMSHQLEALMRNQKVDVGLDVEVLQIDPSLAKAIYALGVKYLMLPDTATEGELVKFSKEVDSIKSFVPVVLQLPSVSTAPIEGRRFSSVVKDITERVTYVAQKSKNVAGCVVTIDKEEIEESDKRLAIAELIEGIRKIILK